MPLIVFVFLFISNNIFLFFAFYHFLDMNFYINVYMNVLLFSIHRNLQFRLYLCALLLHKKNRVSGMKLYFFWHLFAFLCISQVVY